jgi:hypothetical protein
MSTIYEHFHRVDTTRVRWMADKGISLLRLSLGVNFLWFGVLKLFPGLSPAESLAGDTITKLTFGLLPPEIPVPVLGL